jgi:hypothetical protein
VQRIVRKELLPAARREFEDTVRGVPADALQDIDEIVTREAVVEATRDDLALRAADLPGTRSSTRAVGTPIA